MCTFAQRKKNVHIMAMTSSSFRYFGNNICISDYLNDIRKYKVLTNEEEIALIRRYRSGDMMARDELILRNQRFVYSLAKISAKTDDELNDYISEGNIGLIEAFDLFDETKGVKFLTFAVWYIRREMHYYRTNQASLVNRCNNMKYEKKINKVRQRFYAEFGIDPTSEEIVNLLNKNYGINVREISDVYDVNISSISDELSDDYTIEDNDEYNTRTASTNYYEDKINKEYAIDTLNKVMKHIPDINRKVLCYLYGINMDREHSTKEASEHFMMSVSRITNIKKESINMMNSMFHFYKKTI